MLKVFVFSVFVYFKIAHVWYSYWANHLYEVIFYVATMMPNGDPAQMQATKKRLVNGAPVLITWVEDGEDLDGASTLAPDQYANIGAFPVMRFRCVWCYEVPLTFSCGV